MTDEDWSDGCVVQGEANSGDDDPVRALNEFWGRRP
jgi:hypothetical protein